MDGPLSIEVFFVWNRLLINNLEIEKLFASFLRDGPFVSIGRTLASEIFKVRQATSQQAPLIEKTPFSSKIWINSQFFDFEII